MTDDDPTATVFSVLFIFGLVAWAVGLIRGDRDPDALDDERAVSIEIEDRS